MPVGIGGAPEQPRKGATTQALWHSLQISLSSPDICGTRHQFNVHVSDWGFTKFMPLKNLCDRIGCLINNTIVVKADFAVCRMFDHPTYDSRKENDFVFLENRGATCYVKSFMGTLYLTPYFRNVEYHMPRTKSIIPYGNDHLELQNHLYKFQCSDSSATTKALVKSFGLDAYPFLKDDVQGFNGFLFRKHEIKAKGVAVKGTAGQLFEDVYRAVNALGDKYVEVSHQEDDDKYHAENLGLQINGFYSSQPNLHRDGGKYLAPDADLSIGNLYAFHKCFWNKIVLLQTYYKAPSASVISWHVIIECLRPYINYEVKYKLNNERIITKDAKKAFEDQYGFEEEFGHLWEVSNKTPNAEIKLFSESELGLGLAPLPPEKSKEAILFFKLCKPKEEEVCLVGMLFIDASGKPSEILRILNEMTGLMPYEEIKLHETRIKLMFGPKLQQCEYFCRSNSSSKRSIFAPVKACSISLIMSLQSPAMHPRNLCSLVLNVLPKVLTPPSILNKFQKHGQVDPQLMEIAVNLSELPQEILTDIFSLLEIPDLVRAGSVCSSWNSVYANIRSIGQYKKQQTPCLLYTSESSGEKVAHLYSLAEKRAYKLTLPEPPIQKRYLIGSSHGWLVTVDERSEMHLVNPITSEQIALPSVITIEQVKPIYDDTGAICKYLFSSHATQPVTRRPLTVTLDKLRYYLHHKALVFHDTSAGSYIVVLIYNPLGQLSFARIGDAKWTRLSSHTHFQDCIYKKSVLYAVTSFGEIIAIDISGTVLSTMTILDRVRNRYGSHRVYIAEAPCGDLLQIWRPEVWIEEEVGHQHEATFQNKVERMEIYKVCTAAKKLVQIDSLDSYVLFLGNNQSLCFRAEEYPQLKPNHVYFTDDVELVAYSCERGYRLNIGVLNFGNKSMEEIIFPRPWSNCLAPLLIIPNPRKMDSSSHI